MFIIFIIIILQYVAQMCQIQDPQLVLGDYYTTNGEIMAWVEFKSYQICDVKSSVNKIFLKYQRFETIDGRYLYRSPIYGNYTLKMDQNYVVRLGNQSLIARFFKKEGLQNISLVREREEYFIQNQDSKFLIPEDMLNINLETFNLIFIKECSALQITQLLMGLQNKFKILIGNSCNNLNHLSYDLYIQKKENYFVTFIEDYVIDRMKVDINQLNQTHLQYKWYESGSLIEENTIRLALTASDSNCLPYGQRISLGYFYTNYNNNDEIINIAYNTLSYCPEGFLHIYDNNGIDFWIKIKETRILNMSKIYENTSYVFTYITYINIVTLSSQVIQKLGQLYYYEIYGDINTQSQKYQFKVPLKEYDNKEHKLIFFGDMDSNWTGNKSKETFDWFQSIQTNQSEYDVLIFEGDMAYDLESLDCQQGDWWLRNMTTFTSYYPLLSTPGNHDSGDNYEFDYYRISFLSPEKPLNTRDNYYNFYSVDLGLVHYVFYNPTNIVYDELNQTEIDFLVSVMEQDFIQAQQNRVNVPWIIVNSHYPMYCSDATDSMCSSNFIALKQFADLFQKYGVAIYMSAHQHNYERDAPFIYNQSQVNTALETDGPAQHIIKNSAAPVYVIEGSAGQEYYTPPVPYPAQPYTVYQTGYNDGIGILTVVNTTHLYFEQIDLVENQVVDYFWVIQDRGYGNEEAINIVLWVIFGLAMTLVIGLGIYYLIRRQKIKEQLLP